MAGVRVVTTETLSSVLPSYPERGGDGYASKVSAWLHGMRSRLPPGVSKYELVLGKSSFAPDAVMSIACEFYRHRPVYLRILDFFSLLVMIAEKVHPLESMKNNIFMYALQQIVDNSQHMYANPEVRKYIAYNSKYFKNNIEPEYKRLRNICQELYDDIQMIQQEKFKAGEHIKPDDKCLKWDPVISTWVGTTSDDPDASAYVVGGLFMSEGRRDFMIDEEGDEFFSRTPLFKEMDSFTTMTHFLPFAQTFKFIGSAPSEEVENFAMHEFLKHGIYNPADPSEKAVALDRKSVV